MIAISNDLFNKKLRENSDNILNQLLSGEGIKDFTLVFISSNPEEDAKRCMPEILKRNPKIVYENSKGYRNQDKLSPKALDQLVDKYNTSNNILIFKDFLDSVNVYDRAKCRFQTLMHELRSRRCSVLVNYDVEEFRRQSDKNINWSYRKGKSDAAKRFHIALRNPENAYILNLETERYFKGYDPRNYKSKRLPDIKKEADAYREKVVHSIEALKSFIRDMSCNFTIFEQQDKEGIEKAYNKRLGTVNLNIAGPCVQSDFFKYSSRSKAEKWMDPKEFTFRSDENGNMIVPKAVHYNLRSAPNFDRNKVWMEEGKTFTRYAFEHDGVTPISFLKTHIYLFTGIITPSLHVDVELNLDPTCELSGRYYERYIQMLNYYEGRGHIYRTHETSNIGYEFMVLGKIFDMGAQLDLSFQTIARLILEEVGEKPLLERLREVLANKKKNPEKFPSYDINELVAAKQKELEQLKQK
jgi:hypothetical protein